MLTRKFVEVIANIKGLVVVVRVLVVDEFHCPWWGGESGYRGNSHQQQIDKFAWMIEAFLWDLRVLVLLLSLTLALVVDDVFDQQVVVAENDGRVDLREAQLQRLHLRRQCAEAGNAGERRPAGRGQKRRV